MISLFTIIAPLSGCITDLIEEQKIDDGGLLTPLEYDWVDDGELYIVTYDVYGITDEMITEFENQTGYEVTILKLDDAGSVLNHLLQHQDNQVADLAIGLDNTYLPIALNYNVLWKHDAVITNISDDVMGI
jgi:ABC-type thiamine transport system substrate-binding protein